MAYEQPIIIYVSPNHQDSYPVETPTLIAAPLPNNVIISPWQNEYNAPRITPLITSLLAIIITTVIIAIYVLLDPDEKTLAPLLLVHIVIILCGMLASRKTCVVQKIILTVFGIYLILCSYLIVFSIFGSMCTDCEFLTLILCFYLVLHIVAIIKIFYFICTSRS